MAVPDPKDPRPAYEQIADDLRVAIRDGRLRPGDRLPTERDHAARYGVAIGTYRQALSILREERLLVTLKRHGTAVLKPPEDTPSPEYTALNQRLDQIEAEVQRLAKRLDQAKTEPKLSPAGVAERLDQAEAKISGLAAQLAERSRHYDDALQSLAEIRDKLQTLATDTRRLRHADGPPDQSPAAPDPPGWR